MPTLPALFVRTGYVLTLKTGFKALPMLFDERLPGVKFGEEYREFIKSVRPRLRRRRLAVVRDLFRAPLALVHGDTHLENIFFGEQFEGGAMFIDFGLTAIGSPLSDISELLGTGMRPKVRVLPRPPLPPPHPTPLHPITPWLHGQREPPRSGEARAHVTHVTHVTLR